jgi:hypothetical protein
MNTKVRIVAFLILVFSLVLSSCAPGQMLGPALTSTPIPTNTSTPMPTPTNTSTPSPVPGIDTPLTIENIEIKVTSIIRSESVTVDGKQMIPNSSENNFLMVTIFVFDLNISKIDGWDVSLSDNIGNSLNPVIPSFIDYETMAMDTLSGPVTGAGHFYLFEVNKKAEAFVLHLPNESTIVLPSSLP